MLKKFKLKNLIGFILVGSFVVLVVLLQFFNSATLETFSQPNSALSFSKSYGIVEDCTDQSKIKFYFYDTDKDPFEKNNKYGLYIYAEEKEFFKLAEELVNSNGGDWGYVLIPYNIRDRDYEKWREVFENLRGRNLIPIIQLHDVDPEDYEEETLEAALFLNTFVWPIKQRYVSVYNEPNDANFWHGYVDPHEYARILDFTIETFKFAHEDYFMLNGALNVSASEGGTYMDAFRYMSLMNEEVPGIFNKLDGWASHSYPQPNFSGAPLAEGRWSIQAYDIELEYLKNNLDVDKSLPVFITETGWAHAEGKEYNPGFLPVATISEYFKTAFEEVWLQDDRVVAVTPFTIRYEAPFDHFSWVNEDNVPYEHFDAIKSLPKVSGEPQKLIESELEGVCNDTFTNS